ncbi:MAG TPA: hypothetical protein PKI46_01155, partial [Bacteroidales bacterium]|nr:hypothetical protein [Bacteroidales bacterium]
LGISAEDIGAKFKAKDPEAFIDALKQLEKQGADTRQLMELFGQTAGPAMLALLGQGTSAIEKMTKEVTGTNAAFEAAEVQLNNMRGSMQQLEGSIETVQILFGTVFQNAGTVFYQTLIDIVNGISDFLTKSKLLQATEAVITGVFYSAYEILNTLSPILKSTTDAFAALFAKISDGVIAFVDFVKNSDILKTGMEDITNTIKGLSSSFSDYLQDTLGLGETLGFVSNETKKAGSAFTPLESIFKKVSTAATSVVTNFTPIADVVDVAIDSNKQANLSAKELANTYSTIASSSFETFGDTVIKLEKPINAISSGMINNNKTTEAANKTILNYTQSINAANASTKKFYGTLSSMPKTAKVEKTNNADAKKPDTAVFGTASKEIGLSAETQRQSIELLKTAVVSLKDILKTLAISFIEVTKAAIDFTNKFLNLGVITKNSSSYLAALNTTIAALTPTIVKNIESFTLMITEWLRSEDAIETVKTAVNTFFESLKSLGNFILTLPETFDKLLTILSALKTLFITIAPPLFNLATMFAKLILNIMGVNNDLPTMGEAFQSVTTFIVSFIAMLQKIIVTLLEYIKYILETTGAMEKLEGWINNVKNKYQEWITILQNSGYLDQLSGVITILITKFTQLKNAIEPYIPKMVAVTGAVINFIKNTEPIYLVLIPGVIGALLLLSSFASTSSPQLGVIFTGLLASIYLFKDSIINALLPAMDTFKNAFDSLLKGNFTEAFNGMIAGLNIAFPTLISSLTQLGTTFTNTYTKIMSESTAQGNQALQTGLGQSAIVAQAETQKTTSVFESFGVQVAAVLIATGQTIVTALIGVFSYISTSAIPEITNFLTGIKSGFEAGFKQLPQPIQEGLKNLWEAIKIAFAAGIQILVNDIPKLMAALKTAITNWWATAQDNSSIEAFITNMYNLFVALWQTFVENISTIIYAMLPVIAAVFAQIGYGLGQIAVPIFIAALTGIVAAIVGFFAGMASTFTPVINNLMAVISGDIKTMGDGALATISTFLVGAFKGFSDFVSTLFAANIFVAILSKYWDGFKATFVAAAEPRIKDTMTYIGTSLRNLGAYIGMTFSSTIGGETGKAIASLGKFFMSISSSIKTSAARIITAIVSFGSLMLDAFKGVWSLLLSGDILGALKQFLSNLVNMFTIDLGTTLTKIISGFMAIIGGWRTMILAVINPIAETLVKWGKETFGAWGQAVINVLTLVSAGLLGFFVGGPIGAILAGLSALGVELKIFGASWESIWLLVASIFATIWDIIMSALSGIVAAIPAILGGIITAIGKVFGSETITSIGNWFMQLAKSIYGWLKTNISDPMYNFLIGHSLIDDLPEWFDMCIDALIAFFVESYTKLENAWLNLWAFIVNKKDFYVQKALEIPIGIIQGIQDTLNGGAQVISDTFNSIWSFMSETITTVIGYATEIGNGIVNTLTEIINTG